MNVAEEENYEEQYRKYLQNLKPVYEEVINFALEQLNQNVPETLYHYTTYQGFLGILETKSLHATHFMHLNDSSEYKQAFNIINETIEKSNFLSLSRATQGVENSFRYDYVISFCDDEKFAENGTLSQCRAYSNNGLGLRIGFNTKYLKRILDEKLNLDKSIDITNFLLTRCIYDDKDKRKTCETLRDKFTEEQYVEILPGVADMIFGPAFKQSGFKEENEWRLMFGFTEFHSEKRLQFKTTQNEIKPYLEIKFSKDEFNEIIESVTIGPCSDFQRSRHALELLLDQNSLHDIRIMQSNIPYRG